MTTVLGKWDNVQAAVNNYLSAIKGGGYREIQPMFAPVALINHKIAAALAAQGISYVDFVRWSAAAQKTAKVHGKSVPKSKFAFAPGDDPSKWKLPVDTPGRAKNALARVNQTKGIPAEKKAGVINKIRKVAKKKGVEVSDKTPGQKKWMKSAEMPTPNTQNIAQQPGSSTFLKAQKCPIYASVDPINCEVCAEKECKLRASFPEVGKSEHDGHMKSLGIK
jgi:hypothetical protein